MQFVTRNMFTQFDTFSCGKIMGYGRVGEVKTISSGNKTIGEQSWKDVSTLVLSGSDIGPGYSGGVLVNSEGAWCWYCGTWCWLSAKF